VTKATGGRHEGKAPHGYTGKHVPGGERDTSAKSGTELREYVAPDGKSGAVTSVPKDSSK
jgi:hypothetical protein